MSGRVFQVIMAGGSGTRFWPASRVSNPKQFLALVSDRPLIREAFDRAAAFSNAGDVYIAAGLSHRDKVLETLPGLDPSHYIAEPCARNTAPCIGLAALRLSAIDPAGVMIVSPADHVYGDPSELYRCLGLAVESARRQDVLVTLGIKPTRAETGYGYIEVGSDTGPDVMRVERFVEKPDAETAERYLRSGRHLWNSGVFVWRTEVILEAIRRHVPDLWRGLKTIEKALGGSDEDSVIREVFESLNAESIDYAVLEKEKEVLVVPTDPGWSDVGSWDAVAELRSADPARTVIAKEPGYQGEVVTIDSEGCFVVPSAESGRAIALIGVKDLVVVDTGDALLVCRKGASQSVREVVKELAAKGRNGLL